MVNTVIRRGKFDAGHRVMHERFKCFNVHGHEYHYELEFSYRNAEEIGYAIDFKEIKRVACEWIDERLDHGFIANPKDHNLIHACEMVGSKLYRMSLAGTGSFCNPSAENIAKEIFYAVSLLMNDPNLQLTRVRLQETVNCSVECEGLSQSERAQLDSTPLRPEVLSYRAARGKVEYDERKLTDQ